MATIRPGSKQVLMIVDVQVGVMVEAWERQPVIARIAHAVQKARAAGVPVVWVQHSNDERLPQGSAAWQWVPELQPGSDEARIHKRYNSGFEETPLEALLAELGAAHIVLAGAMTNACIRATAYAALERGYDLTLLADAHTTASFDVGDGRRLDAAQVVLDLNLSLRWLSYPGRRNAAVAVDDFSFAT